MPSQKALLLWSLEGRMRRKSGSAGPPQAPMEVDREALERARLARELALEDLSEAKRKLGEAERKLTEREDDLEARVRRIARKLEARRRRQHRIDALRGRFAERDFVKGKQRKESQLARGEARLEERESELVRRSAELQAQRAELDRREQDLRARETELDRQATEFESARTDKTEDQIGLDEQRAELDRREQELVAREAAVAELEPRERAAAAKGEELGARERK